MLRRGWAPVVVALSVAVVLLAAAWPAGGAGAAAGCTVELSWSGQDAAVGSELQLQVRLVGAVDVYAAEVHLRYDPARLEATATRVEAGDLFGGKRTFAALNEVDAVEGKVAYAVTLLGEPAGVTGDGVLCRLKVRAKARGDAGLAIESVRLLDSKAMDIKCSLSVIPLTIDGSAGGGPSPGGGAPSGGSPPAGGVPSGSAPGGTPAGGGTAGGSAGGGGGGGSSPASGSAAPASGGARFEDTVGHWAEQAISFLAQQGIVAGVGEGRFCPDEHVTREQFTKILVLALGEEPVAAPHTGMEDLPASRWSAGYVARGVQMGFISGYREGGRVLFKPGQPITRAEMACMMVRALDLRLVLPQTATFRDVPLDHWAAPYVEAAYRAGLVTGVAPGLFAPEDPATRAQACVIVARMLGQR